MVFKGARAAVVGLIGALALQAVTLAAAPDSARLGRAKDFIADEQWSKAIAELRVAMADAKEKSKDEALYWLAHSLNQAGDSAAAIAMIRRLEREYPSSLWVKPAGSLRLDIAIHLKREDVLWWTAAPPPPPPPPPAPAPRPVYAPRAPAPPAAPGPVVAPAPPASPAPPAAPAAPAPPAPPAPPAAWLPEFYRPDTDLRIQALGSLIQTDALKVIPMLREIALTSGNAREASRAVFVLAQSDKAEARATVVQVAKAGSELVRIAAVRELGRFAGPEVSQALMQVYGTANVAVKIQVVTSLGERSEGAALLRIAETETDPHVKATAIVTLGQAGGPLATEQLRLLYKRAGSAAKRPIIIGLFNARAEEELIRIAEQEQDPELRAEALLRLRLLGTAKAKEYLQKAGGIR